MSTIAKSTLLDLVRTINEFSTSDAETVATAAYLINSGKVQLSGNFAGAKIDLAVSTNPVVYQRLSVPVSFRKAVYLAAQ